MQIDIRTLIFIIGITHIIQFVIFYIQFKVVKVYKGIGWWLLWSALEIIGFLAILFRDLQSIFNIIIILQNTTIILGMLCIYIGYMRFVGKKVNKIVLHSVIIVYLTVFLYFLFIDYNLQLRSEIVNSSIVFISFFTGYNILKFRLHSIKLSVGLISSTMFIHGLIFLYRTIAVGLGVNAGDPFTVSFFNIIPFVDVLFVAMIWTYGFILMINQRSIAEMAEAKSHFEQVFNTSPDGAVITRLSDGLIIDINTGYTVLTGYTREDSIGKSSLGINLWKNTDDRQSVVSILKEKGSCYNYEAVFIRKNGTELTGLLSAKIITLQDTPHIISITREITERKKIEDEIKKLNEELELRVKERTLELEAKSTELNENQAALLNLVEDLNEKSSQLALSSQKLEQANKELEAFSYSVSHDLRAPLRGIDGFSLALMEDYYKDLDDTAKDYIKRIRNSTMRMDKLIDSMLKLSRVTRFELKYEKINLSKLINEIADRLKIAEPHRNADFKIQNDVYADADKYLLSIGLENLLNNAWKYSSKKEKTVIEFGTIIKDSKIIYFIKDNGSGFDMKYYDKLFGAFQRLHSSKDYPGTGIGLATTQRIIRRHGGEIWAESIENKETTFYFTF